MKLFAGPENYGWSLIMTPEFHHRRRFSLRDQGHVLASALNLTFLVLEPELLLHLLAGEVDATAEL